MAKLNEVRFNRKYTENQLKQFADDLANGKPTPLVDGTYYQPDSGGKLYYYSVKTGLSIAGEKNNFIGFYLGEHDPQHPEKNPMVSGGIVEITPDAIGAATPEEVDDKIKAATTSVYRFKGSVVSYDQLPSNPNDVETGDVYDVNNGTNYAAIIEENGYSVLEEYLQSYMDSWTFGNVMRRLGVSVDNVSVDYEYRNDKQSTTLNGIIYEPGELTVRPVLKGSSVYFMAKPNGWSYQYVVYDNNNLVTRDLSDSALSYTLGLPYTQHKAKTVVWDALGGIFDTTNLATKTELSEHKQEVQSTIDTHKQQVQTTINTAKQQVQSQITNIENAIAEKDAVHAGKDEAMEQQIRTIADNLGTASQKDVGTAGGQVPIIGEGFSVGDAVAGKIVVTDYAGRLVQADKVGNAAYKNVASEMDAEGAGSDLVTANAVRNFFLQRRPILTVESKSSNVWLAYAYKQGETYRGYSWLGNGDCFVVNFGVLDASGDVTLGVVVNGQVVSRPLVFDATDENVGSHLTHGLHVIKNDATNMKWRVVDPMVAFSIPGKLTDAQKKQLVSVQALQSYVTNMFQDEEGAFNELVKDAVELGNNMLLFRGDLFSNFIDGCDWETIKEGSQSVEVITYSVGENGDFDAGDLDRIFLPASELSKLEADVTTRLALCNYDGFSCSAYYYLNPSNNTFKVYAIPLNSQHAYYFDVKVSKSNGEYKWGNQVTVRNLGRKIYAKHATNADYSDKAGASELAEVSQVAERAEKLTATRTINGMKFDGSKNVCSYFRADKDATGQGALEYKIDLTEDFVLENGTRITVRVSDGNTEGKSAVNLRCTMGTGTSDSVVPINMPDGSNIGARMDAGIYDLVYDDSSGHDAWYVVSGGGSGKLYWEE